ncbi:hypothetical protein ACJX0J_036786, partial [Zea mays]
PCSIVYIMLSPLVQDGLAFFTIHDYKGLGNILGLSTQGYKACYICQENTNKKLYTWDIVGGHAELIHTERMPGHDIEN